MSTQERTPQEYAVGSLIRVQRGVTAPNNPDMPIGGWLGTVSQASGGICLVRWNGATLEAIPPVYRQWCERTGADINAMWLQNTVLEGDQGEPLCIEQGERVETSNG
jgi:hypothetical protein